MTLCSNIPRWFFQRYIWLVNYLACIVCPLSCFENGSTWTDWAHVPEFLRLVFQVLAFLKVQLINFVNELCFVQKVLFAFAYDYILSVVLTLSEVSMSSTVRLVLAVIIRAHFKSNLICRVFTRRVFNNRFLLNLLFNHELLHFTI